MACHMWRCTDADEKWNRLLRSEVQTLGTDRFCRCSVFTSTALTATDEHDIKYMSGSIKPNSVETATEVVLFLTLFYRLLLP